MNHSIQYLALLLAVVLFAPRAPAQPGALDPSFGDGGVVLIDSSSVWGLALQPDGRIVVTGVHGAEEDYADTFPALWRFHPDGAADVGFGTNSIATLTDPGSPRNVAVHPSGDLLATGTYSPPTEPPGYGVAWRVSAEGVPVSTFGAPEEPGVALTRPDGRFIVVGNDDIWGDQTCEVWQYLDGTDTSFPVTFSLGDDPYDSTWCGGGALLEDGRLVVFLWYWDYDGADYWGAARVLENGTLDPTFGDGGIALVPLDGLVRTGAVAADGAVYVGGQSPGYGGPGPRSPTLLRLTAEGVLDDTFGEEGVATLEGLGEGVARDIVVGPDGKLLVGLTDGVGRLLADGTLDPAFGVSGIATLDAGLRISALVLNSEERIIVAGRVSGPEPSRSFVARLLNDAAVATEPSVQPERLALSSPAPNPTSGRISLTYTLAAPAPVRLAVYDVLGREVAVLAVGMKPAGQHEARFDAERLAPGLYIVRLTGGGEVATRRFTVVR